MQVPSLCELYVEMIKTILGESTLYGKRKNTESPLSAFERIFGVLFDQSMRDVIDANSDDDNRFIDTLKCTVEDIRRLICGTCGWSQETNNILKEVFDIKAVKLDTFDTKEVEDAPVTDHLDVINDESWDIDFPDTSHSESPNDNKRESEHLDTEKEEVLGIDVDYRDVIQRLINDNWIDPFNVSGNRNYIITDSIRH